MKKAEKIAYMTKLRELSHDDLFVEWGRQYDARSPEHIALALAEISRRPPQNTMTIKLGNTQCV